MLTREMTVLEMLNLTMDMELNVASKEENFLVAKNKELQLQELLLDSQKYCSLTKPQVL
jgi:hypothetical protein